MAQRRKLAHSQPNLTPRHGICPRDVPPCGSPLGAQAPAGKGATAGRAVTTRTAAGRRGAEGLLQAVNRRIVLPADVKANQRAFRKRKILVVNRSGRPADRTTSHHLSDALARWRRRGCGRGGGRTRVARWPCRAGSHRWRRAPDACRLAGTSNGNCRGRLRAGA